MARVDRLPTDEDFRRVRRGGSSWTDRLLVLFVARGPSERPRVGISVSKRVGGAVVRNRVRRRVREALASRYPHLPAGTDVVVLVRPSAADAPFSAIDAAVGSLLERAGLLTAGAEWSGSSKV